MVNGLLRFLMGLLAPIILIIAGAGVAAAGIDLAVSFLFWAGALLVVAGVIWGLFLYFVAESGSFWD